MTLLRIWDTILNVLRTEQLDLRRVVYALGILSSKKCLS